MEGIRGEETALVRAMHAKNVGAKLARAIRNTPLYDPDTTDKSDVEYARRQLRRIRRITADLDLLTEWYEHVIECAILDKYEPSGEEYCYEDFLEEQAVQRDAYYAEHGADLDALQDMEDSFPSNDEEQDEDVSV